MDRVDKSCDAPYLHHLEHIDFRPVFIMGHHRSGTTIFYKLLSETNRLNTCSLYHVIYRHGLLHLHLNSEERKMKKELEIKLNSFSQNSRGFDKIDVSTETPEEYCYALAHQGKRPILNDRNLHSFLDFSRKLQFIQDTHKPLLYKNPFDMTNFLYIKEKLPSSQFVFIHRNPVAVINSQIKTIRSLFEKRNEYVALVVDRYRKLWEQPVKRKFARNILSKHLPILVSQVISNVSRENQRLLERIDSLPEESQLHVTYEQLCENPNIVITEVLNFLHTEPMPKSKTLSGIQKRPLDLLPEVARRIPYIIKKNKPYCNRFSIGINEDHS